MYKILIVDDEKMIREGIRAGIDWKSIGIGEACIAGSGREAMEIIREKRPEILLTDISMTEMTGLELVREAKKICPALRVLMLTGYDSFDYAREALRLQVEDFLLKPVDEELLKNTIYRQVESLREQDYQRVKEIRRYRTRGIEKQRKLEDIFRKLVQGTTEKEELDIIREEFGYPVAENVTAVIIQPQLHPELVTENGDFTGQQLLTLSVGMIDSKELGISVWNGRELVIALFSRKCGSDGVDIVRDIGSVIENEYGENIRSAMGNEVGGIHEFYKSYRDALYLLENERTQLQDVLLSQTILSKSHLFRDVYQQLLTEMEDNISNIDYVLRIFDAFCMAGKSYNLSRSYLKKCCFEIASKMYYINIENGCGKSEQTLEQLMEAMGNSDGDSICGLTRGYLEKILNPEEGHELIGRAKRYINQNLNQDLSVATIAEQMYVSANYFSRLFKKVTGERCNEYIVKKRMEKAATLLTTTSFNAGKIAEMVGYPDSNYFSLSFKKNFGLTPTNYRSQKE